MSAGTKTAPLYGWRHLAATAPGFLFFANHNAEHDKCRRMGALIYNPAFSAHPTHRMFTPDQLHTISAQLALKSDRTQLIELDGAPIIVKQLEAPLKHWGYPVLNTLARLLGQPMLRAVPAPGGSEAQAIEIARLRSLAAAGVSVPEVLHVTPEWFALSFLGATSVDQLLRQQPEQGQQHWENGLQAILDLHRLGQTASQCFARNMIAHEGQISFIDFEDDPSKVMPLAAAQARDWLLYLHSTAYILNMKTQDIAQVFLGYVQQDDAAVQREVKRAARAFGWLRILPNKRKPWGRDVVSAQAAGQVLHFIAKQNT
ncbi:lipopolysaccharide kinase InaA family protein [Herminiimonas arsenitoxidans]|uniref:lipopolysaccharide kinase InaA family protein n=1 Tax=Herminiimonas arsenitoxidans TaxID=1809410 RepID=UPI001E30C7B9|nr:lipopolysaccharide kinase InaA family protein [Herminiimonas arsenitoxidans]